MNFLGIIPARFASTRFPGKPLAIIGGKTMIQRVYEQAKKASSINDIIVATDDVRIFDHVKSFEGKVIMTSSDHPTGTDRCAEVLTLLKGEWDGVINIQGDEPFILPEQIDLLAKTLDHPKVDIATLVKEITDAEELLNVNCPKVVLSNENHALYFSRQPIPFLKGEAIENWIKFHQYYKHIGIYGYKANVLPLLSTLVTSKLEKAESLEQLRWLENGFTIKAGITSFETIAIDRPEDLLKAESLLS